MSADPEWLRHLRDVVATRGDSYAGCVRTSVCRRENSQLSNLLTKFEFCPPLPESCPSWVSDYGQVTVARGFCSVECGMASIQRLAATSGAEQGAAPCALLSNIAFAPAFAPFAKTRWSHSEWTDWPADITTLFPTSSAPWLPNESLVAIDAPYFTSFEQLLSEYFTIRRTQWENQFNGQVVIVLPDFRARITGLRVFGRSFRAEIEPGTSPCTELLLKAVAESDRGQIEHVSVNVSCPVVERELTRDPSFLSVALISWRTGDLIQEKAFRAGALDVDPGVEYDPGLPEIEQLCLTGEGETIEFKRNWSDTTAEKLSRTVVAFANTKGGTIAFGIDDELNVVGCDTRGLPERITSVIGSRCDPPPMYTIREVKSEDRVVLLVRVIASDLVVHVARDDGPYVRANRNNRRPGAVELANLFRSRSATDEQAL